MIDTIVSGASGFIGQSLCRRLLTDGIELLGLSHNDGDVADQSVWEALPPAKQVVHLAGCSYVPASWEDSARFLRTNVLGTENAITYCRRHDARMIYVSGYVYGIPESLPISEDHPVRPNNPYALSKYLAEQLCGFASNHHQQQVIVLRLFNVYGPGQRADFLIPAIVSQVLEGNEIRVMDLNPRRDYVYIDDVVDAICSASTITGASHTLNIGSGDSYSVSEVIDQIQAVAGTSLPVVSSSRERANEIPDVLADITQARHILDWEPRWTFPHGLEQIFILENTHD